jgi:hypothetical protein
MVQEMITLFLSFLIAHPPSYCDVCQRDSRGRIKRSKSVRRQFQREHPCPANGATKGACPGYVVEHMTALKHGGADLHENMQWENVAEARAKDRVED